MSEHELVEMRELDDDHLVLTFKNRSYSIREAGPGATIPAGCALFIGASGRRRKPVMMTTMWIGNAFQEIIDGTVPKEYHTFFLLPEDFRELKNVGYQSARKKFQVIVGGKQ